jgi:hypothetical protein
MKQGGCGTIEQGGFLMGNHQAFIGLGSNRGDKKKIA